MLRTAMHISTTMFARYAFVLSLLLLFAVALTTRAAIQEVADDDVPADSVCIIPIVLFCCKKLLLSHVSFCSED